MSISIELLKVCNKIQTNLFEITASVRYVLSYDINGI